MFSGSINWINIISKLVSMSSFLSGNLEGFGASSDVKYEVIIFSILILSSTSTKITNMWNGTEVSKTIEVFSS